MSEIELGLYRLAELPDGSGVLSRAIGLCETCRHHACGTVQEPIILPAAVIKVLTGKQIEMHEIMGLAASLPGGFLKGLSGRGRKDSTDGSGSSAETGQGRRAARRARTGADRVGLPDQTGNSPADPASPAAAR